LSPGQGSEPPGSYALPKALKKIAILLIFKGIAIAFVNLFDYICIAKKQNIDISNDKGSL
jgi:hypothetical protein